MSKKEIYLVYDVNDDDYMGMLNVEEYGISMNCDDWFESPYKAYEFSSYEQAKSVVEASHDRGDIGDLFYDDLTIVSYQDAIDMYEMKNL